jgi:hypothetical protein
MINSIWRNSRQARCCKTKVHKVLRLSTPLLRDFSKLYPGAPGLDFNDACWIL